VHKSDQRIVVAIGALVGITIALQGLRPTGNAVIDWVLLVASAVAVTWASATAPWWTLALLAAGATVIAPVGGATLVGVGALVLALAIGVLRRSQPLERALVAGASILVLAVARRVVILKKGGKVGECLTAGLGSEELTTMVMTGNLGARALPV